MPQNWGNWQYNAGVGNDPREGGMGRMFNPIKQSHDYDPQGEYIKAWVQEVHDVQNPTEAFQYGEPMKRIEYRGGGGGRGGRGGRGGGRGGGGRGGGKYGGSSRGGGGGGGGRGQGS